MKHLGLFEGIGGFSLAARWTGWETVAWCEINPFCQKVLKHHFPEADQLTDITKTDFTPYANRIDILTGGDPCQPSSKAGKQKGFSDPRFLWPEKFRAIREIQPPWVVNENVRGTISNGMLDKKISDLESIGYSCWPPILLPSCAGEALHERYRVWLVAYSDKNANRNNAGEIQGKARQVEIKEQGQNRERMRPQLRPILTERNWREVASKLCRGVDELPNKLDRNQAIGNAIDPFQAFEIFKAIQKYNQLKPSLINP